MPSRSDPPSGLVSVFLVFGLAYLLSSSLRGITAVLAPAFVQEFHLQPAQLGVLGGAYFLGFALMQLPAGAWLDRLGARRVLAASLLVAVAGCWLFGTATSFAGLVVARFACGVGVSACLIAPLTSARLWLPPARQQQVNLWMLMIGALGLLLASLPAQWLADRFGWRILFVAMAAAFVAIAWAIWRQVPPMTRTPPPGPGWLRSYGAVLRSRHTWKMAPLGFLSYAILVAVQSLWAGPWLTDVAGLDPQAAAWGLFGINLVMLVVFLALGFVTPLLVRSHLGAVGALRLGLPLSVAALLWIPLMGHDASWVHFAVYCAASAVLALTHPAVGQLFAAHLAGRAIAFFNLLLFLGVFIVQWGVGRVIELVLADGGDMLMAYQVAFFTLAALSLGSYLWFLGFDRFFRGGPAADLEPSAGQINRPV